MGSNPDRIKQRTTKLVLVASPLSTQEVARAKTGWLRIRINVSQWSDMSTRGLLFQYFSAMKTQARVLGYYKADIIIILL